MPSEISSSRRDYGLSTLSEESLPRSPLDLLQSWLDTALKAAISDANAMSIATIDNDGFPNSRIVLLRGITDEGLKFYTNYASAKGKEIQASPKSCANFFWSDLERQVRVQGILSKTSPEDSDSYFASRPRESQIGAWASPQSQVIADRSELDDMFSKRHLEFANLEVIPRPPFWGGYILKPHSFEFWQGRPSRLHDRFYVTKKQDTWNWRRLAP